MLFIIHPETNLLAAMQENCRDAVKGQRKPKPYENTSPRSLVS